MKRLLWIPLLAALALGGRAQFIVTDPVPNAGEEVDFFGNDFPPIGNEGRAFRRSKVGSETPAKNEDQQTLMFHNGRQLRGELVAVTKDEIVWRRKDASEPLHVARTDVRRVVFVPLEQLADGFQMDAGFQPTAQKGSPMWATVKLPGADWLRGKLTSPDGDKFSLAMKGGAPLEVPRAQIEWLALSTKPTPAAGLGVGTMALDGWLSEGTPRIEMKDGTTLIHDASWIGRNLAAPSRFEIAFEVPDDGEEGLELWIQPFNPQPNCYSTGTVHFRFGKTGFRWLIYQDSTQSKEEKFPGEALADKGPFSYRVLYDAPNQRVVVLRNGRKLGDWSLKPKAGAPNGGDMQQRLPRGFCLSQAQRNDKTLMKLRKLSLLPWDGTVPEPGAAAPKEDRLSTAGPTPTDGKLEAIREKEIVFSGKEIPMVAESYLLKFPQSPAAMADSTAMVSFGDQGELSVADLRVEEGKVHGRSVFAPEMELPAETLQCISFPPQKPGAAAPGDLLVFKNSDELPGALVSAGTNAPVRWRLGSGQEIEFQADRVAGVHLTSAPRVESAGTVELRSGERLRGKVTAFGEQTMQWNHPVLGDLALDREQVWRLYPNPQQSLMDGGQNPDHWLRDVPNLQRFMYYSRMRPRDGAWLALDGRFVLRSRDNGNGEQTQGPVCDVTPGLERYELRVDVAFPSQNPGSLMVNFLSGEQNGGGAVVNLSSYELNVYVQNPKNRNGGGNREMPLRDKIGENARQLCLRAFVDRKIGSIELMVNGFYMGRTGQSTFDRVPGLGKSIAIDAYAYGRSDLVLSQVTIVPWGGELPRFGEATPSTVLANGDTVPGVPSSLAENNWKLESEIGALELPAEKVQAVEFGGEMKPSPAAGRLRLVDGSTLLVDRFQWGGSSVVAHHPVFGDLRLRAADVSELIYNPAPVRPPVVQDPKKTAKKEAAKGPIFFR